MSLERKATHRLTVKRPTLSKDSAGGVVETFSTVYTNVRAYVANTNTTEGAEYGKRTTRDTPICLLPDNEAVTESDVVVIGGAEYVVRGSTRYPGTGTPRYTRLDVERIT